MCRCGEGIIATNGERVRRAVTQRCHSWNCPECEPRRRNGLTALGFAGDPTGFLTFTMPPKPGEPLLAFAKRMTAALRIWLKLVKRKHPKAPFEYLVIPHAHKSGYAHLHMLTRGLWFDHAWSLAQWNRLTQATRLDMQVPRTRARVAIYVTGYTAGKTAKFGKMKRYWQSKGWDKRPKRDKRAGLDHDETWITLRECVISWAERHALDGFDITWRQPEYAIAQRPP